MTTRLFRGYFIVLLFPLFISCTSRKGDSEREILADSVSIKLGRKIFTENCSACHNFKEDGIGPQLGGLTLIMPVEWIKKFIRDPKTVLESGDERASLLHEQFKTIMPSFPHYTEEELNGLVAYLATQKAPARKSIYDPNALKDPIPDTIPLSDLVVEIEEVTQIPPSSDKGQLTRICKLDTRPGSDDLFIVDLRGRLYQLKDNQPILYLDMVKERSKFIEKPGLATGFGSFAFHPEFQKNGLLYTSHTEGPDSGIADFTYPDSIKVLLQWVLTEWKTDTPGALPFAGKGRELLRVNMVHSYHGMQEITFNPLAKPGDDDYALLYIGIGDGSSVEFGYPSLAHSKEKILGTIIRIDPAGKNSKNGKYRIPPNNPFAKDENPNTVKEIYAYGFRNPHRISWTSSGQIIASNIGHHNIESLNLILPGHDYGWPLREGGFVMDLSKGMNNIYPLPSDDKKNNITYPIAQYDHDEGNAISGGFEYWGKTIPELKGKYLFGDIVKGRLFYVEMKDVKVGAYAPIKEWRITLGGKLKTLVELCGADKVDVRFGRDNLGEIYIMTKPDGRVYKLVRARRKAT